jgi:carbon storage regulator
MLVLTRKLGEEIIVGGRIKFSIVQIDGDRERVRIGIEAPPEIAVHRGEVFQKVLEQNRDAVFAQEAELKKLARYWANVAQTASSVKLSEVIKTC